jgi:nitrite transporter NirC
VWAASLFGNLVGSLAFAALVNASGVVTAGAPAGQQTVYQAALAGIVKSKASLSGGQLFFRAVLCNMLVCLALWMAARAASDAAKLVCLWWALLAFIASGFEHSIANMTGLGLAAFIGVGSWSELGRNLLYTVPGNVVGGAVLVGLAYAWIGKDAAPRPRAQRVEPALVDLEPETDEVLTKPKSSNGRTSARAATATATRPTKRAPRTTTPPAHRRTR